MPLGQRALDPKTPYLVYEFSYNGKVFYVGHAHGAIRHTQRWSWVKNLLRHEDAGTLTPAKAAALKQKSNSVIAALIRSGFSEYKVDVPCRGLGKSWAEVEETKRILKRVSQGCRLANVAGNPRPASVDEILCYLGVKNAA